VFTHRHLLKTARGWFQPRNFVPRPKPFLNLCAFEISRNDSERLDPQCVVSLPGHLKPASILPCGPSCPLLVGMGTNPSRNHAKGVQRVVVDRESTSAQRIIAQPACWM